MGIVLGPNQYGKAENRIVRIVRDSPRHEIRDLNVTTALRGRFAPAHLEGDQSVVLPTDTQKQTAYAWAKTVGIDSIETYAIALASRFAGTVDEVESSRVEVDEYEWVRAVVDGVEHDHTWTRAGAETRTTAVTVQKTDAGTSIHVVGGLKDLVILKSTGSAFKDFLTDEFTVLEPAEDRILATSLVARWLFAPGAERSADNTPVTGVEWDVRYARIRQALVATFANHRSLALQQTLYRMGAAALAAVPELDEIRFSAPNKHHFVYDLQRFGIPNDNEVFHADDRPYGLIQATVLRDDAVPRPLAWATSASFTG